MMLLTWGLFAQSDNQNQIYTPILDSIPIALNKTTSLVFPFAIKSVDRGTKDILIQKVKGFENILQIKAANRDFVATNLTVVTSDGILYSFIIYYNERSPVLSLNVGKTAKEAARLIFSNNEEDKGQIETYGRLALCNQNHFRSRKVKKYGILFQLTGIGIHDDVMYYRIQVQNNSKIKYNIEQLRFFIRDSKKMKRTASQEIEMLPISILNNVTEIREGSQNVFVFAVPKFTIAEQKYLAIQLIEKQGGRHLELAVKNKVLQKITILSNLNQ